MKSAAMFDWEYSSKFRISQSETNSSLVESYSSSLPGPADCVVAVDRGSRQQLINKTRLGKNPQKIKQYI